MKPSFKLAALVIIIIILSGCKGCSYSKGFSENLNTKLSAKYNGFTVEKFALVDAGLQPLTGNKVQSNSKFSIIAYNIGNYAVVNNKVYPACEVTLTDKSGKQILHVPDIFAEEAKDGVSTQNGKLVTVTATYTIPAELKGQQLHANVHITDKMNSKNEITITDDVVAL